VCTTVRNRRLVKLARLRHTPGICNIRQVTVGVKISSSLAEKHGRMFENELKSVFGPDLY